MITSKSIEEVHNAINIVDVVDDFVTLKKKGANYQGVCPFHDEKTPSFYVSPARGIYKCFGCGKGGNAINFVMDHEQLSYIDAIRYLANKYRIELKETELSAEERQARDLSESLYILNEFAMGHYQKNLFDSDEGRAIGLSYFKERGFLEATIKTFGLGYANGEKDELTKAALRKQFKLDHLKLVRLTNEYNGDFFRSRVMFAIHNLSGKVVGFTGRILTNDKTQSKYVNSPESEIYVKHKVLYGLYQAKAAIKKENECIIVEGNTDVITLYQGGLQNVVATSGTAMHREQVRLIKRFTDNVKLVYDGDNAGIKAALRGLDIILEEGLNIRLVLLPKGEDPDSAFKSMGLEAFKQYLKDQEKDFILFQANYLLQFAGEDPIRKIEVYKDIIASLAKVQDHMKRLTYITLCSELMKMNEKVLVSEVSKIMDTNARERFRDIQRQKIQENRKRIQDGDIPLPERIVDEEDGTTTYTVPAQTIVYTGDEYQEQDLARILICGGEKYYDQEQKITIALYLFSNLEDSLDLFQNKLYRRVYEYALQLHDKGEVIDANSFINCQEQDISKFAIDVLYSPYTYAKWEERNIYLQTQPMPEENYQKDAYYAIMRFKLKKTSTYILDMSKNLENNQMDDEEKALEIKVLSAMIKERNEIANELNNVVL